MSLRFVIAALTVTFISALVCFGAPGDTTTIGPHFSFGNISTQNLKVRSTRTTDTVKFAGTGGLSVSASGKVVSFDGSAFVTNTVFKNYTSVDRLTVSAFSTYTSVDKLPRSVFTNYTTVDRLPTSIAAATYVPYTSATKDVKLGGHFLELGAMSNPASPPAGHVRFHAATTQGFTRFEQDNEAATNLVLGRDNVIIGRNTTVSSIPAGTPVYVTGSTGNVPNIAPAKADSTATLPAIGVTLDAIGANSFGQVMKTGVISSINTSAFSAGDTLWVDATTAGALTKTRPVYPNFPQRIGSVLVSGVGNGSILITTAPFIGGMDSGTNAATFTGTTFIGALTGNASTATSLAGGAAGNLPYQSAANTTALLSLVANAKLFGNAAGTAPEFATGYKIGTFTYDTSTASGTQAITGVGFKPSLLVLMAIINDTQQVSIGFDDGTNHYCLINEHNAAATLWFSSATLSIELIQSGSDFVTGAVTTLGTDGFTITWTKTGSKTGTATIYYLAMR